MIYQPLWSRINLLLRETQEILCHAFPAGISLAARGVGGRDGGSAFPPPTNQPVWSVNFVCNRLFLLSYLSIGMPSLLPEDVVT